MKGSRTLTLLCLLPFAVGAAERSPLRNGEHAFRHRSAVHPNLPAHPLVARITGTRIVLTNSKPSSVFPLGVVAEGELMWDAASKQWIHGYDPADRTSKEVGGCSDGPEVVDLRRRTYWTC
ncbi:MAG: hypothetical protein JNM58_07350 [Xanthomonadaceae bacterium]|nr:hypothetical protein [Xanthomonadaceae bacterium]